jgi:hypothetical protein
MDEIAMIEQGQLDVGSLFPDSSTREESLQRLAEFPVQFGPPLSFQISRQQLINKVQELKIDLGHDLLLV